MYHYACNIVLILSIWTAQYYTTEGRSFAHLNKDTLLGLAEGDFSLSRPEGSGEPIIYPDITWNNQVDLKRDLEKLEDVLKQLERDRAEEPDRDSNKFYKNSKRGFDSIEHFSGFGGLGKRGAPDPIEYTKDYGRLGSDSNSIDFDRGGKHGGFDSNEREWKRGFDSLDSASGYGAFEKRALDPIEHISNFGGFGKRSPDFTEDENDFEKRGFDSIEHFSNFGKFGKRGGFDSIEHVGDFGRFSKRGGFDPIEHFSDFGKFGKRGGFDPIEHESDFGRFQKRGGFDSIQHVSDFGRFSKRGGFDSIQHVSDFGRFSKRGGFDSIQHLSDFGKFSKRAFDSIQHFTNFGRFGKRGGFDSIEHLSDFGRLPRKRSEFDLAEDLSDFGKISKRGFDSIQHYTNFGRFAKRGSASPESSTNDSTEEENEISSPMAWISEGSPYVGPLSRHLNGPSSVGHRQDNWMLKQGLDSVSSTWYPWSKTEQDVDTEPEFTDLL